MGKDREIIEAEEIINAEEKVLSRRDFLRSLKKWSKIVIGASIIGAVTLNSHEEAEAAGAWINGGGRGWVNRWGGGGAWANRAGGSGAWANRAGGGGPWANRAGGGGAWVNRW